MSKMGWTAFISRLPWELRCHFDERNSCDKPRHAREAIHGLSSKWAYSTHLITFTVVFQTSRPLTVASFVVTPVAIVVFSFTWNSPRCVCGTSTVDGKFVAHSALVSDYTRDNVPDIFLRWIIFLLLSAAGTPPHPGKVRPLCMQLSTLHFPVYTTKPKKIK